MEFVGVVLVYAGLIAIFLTGVSVIKPIRFLGIRTRKKALVLFGLGLAVIASGFALPAREHRLIALLTRLDEFAPIYQFHEEHSIRVRASPDRCYAAIQDVGPEEIAFVSQPDVAAALWTAGAGEYCQRAGTSFVDRNGNADRLHDAGRRP